MNNSPQSLLQISQSDAAKELLARRKARTSMAGFVAYTKPDYCFKQFNLTLCQQLDRFAQGEIKKLIVTMPPQHGKTELTTRRYPAYKLGQSPKHKIAICSYSDTVAVSFNRDIQRIIDDPLYHNIFPKTYLNDSNVVSNSRGQALRNSDKFETVGFGGFVKTVGVGGPLTSTTVDTGIIDDPFKDREQAKSITYREKVWNWYTDVFRTRLHNDSQELIIMTRWDEDDLVGRVLLMESDWTVVKYEAIKASPKTYYDQREIGEALFPEKHSLEKLRNVERNTPVTFDSLYQQDPKPNKEALVYSGWQEIDVMPQDYPFGYCMDFGFSNDPTAFVQVATHNKRLYAQQIIYEVGLTNAEIKMKILSSGVGPNDQIIADSAEPKSIKELREKTVIEVTEEFKKAYPKLSYYIFKALDGKEFYNLPGLNVKPATKGPDSVSAGIQMLKGYEVFVVSTSQHILYEQRKYEWVMNGNKPTNVPIDAYNHAMDAIRYYVFTKKNNSW